MDPSGSNSRMQPPAETLARHGISPTAQRIRIADVMLARPQHLSADQVLAAVNASAQPVSKATVYNTLNLFCRKGLLREVIVDPARVFYDSTPEPHHHFYDIDTGELQDIPADEVAFSRLPPLPEGTDTDSVEVVIRVRSR